MPFIPDQVQQTGFIPDAPVRTGPPPDPTTIWNDLVSGVESSATGLYARGRLPDVNLDPSHMKWYDKALQGLAGTATDLPLMAGAGIAGAAIGAEVGGPMGAAIGGGAASFEVPAAIRESLVKAYQTGQATKAGDWLSRAGIVMRGLTDPDVERAATKAAVVGGASFGLGKYVGGATESTAARLATEGGAMTVLPAVLDGRLPDAQDFANTAIVMVGMRAAAHVSGKLATIFARTGVPPEQVLADSKQNPSIKEDLTSDSMEVPAAYKPMEAAENAKQALAKPTPPRPLQTVDTLYGSISVDRNRDVPALGSSIRNGTVLFDKDFEPVVPIFGRQYDRTAPLAVHEAVERQKEDQGLPYAKAHSDFAEPAEHTQVLHDFGVKAGTPEAEQLIQAYEDSYKQPIADAAAKVKTQQLDIHPDMIIKPYEHPDSPLEQEDWNVVKAAHERANAPQRMVDEPFGEVPQQPGEPKEKMHVNYNFIFDGDDVKAALAAASKQNAAEIERQTRGKVSNAQSEREAAEYVAQLSGVKDASLLVARKPGTAAGTAEMLTRGALMDAAVKDWVTRIKAYDPLTASPQEKVNILAAAERLQLLHANFIGASSEAGRVLQILKAQRAGLNQTQAILDMLKESEGNLDKVAETMKNVDNPIAAAAVARRFAGAKELTWGQKLGNIFRFDLLLGFKVPQVKLIGDGIATVSTVVEKYVAAAVSKADILSKGDKTRLGEANALLSSMRRAVPEALKVGKSTWDLYGTPQGKSGALEGYTSTFGVKEGQPPAEGTPAAMANKVLSLPQRVIQAETEMMRTLNERGQLGAEAYNQAAKEGFTPGTQEFAARVHGLIEDPTEEMRDAAKRAGDEATFTAKLGQYGQLAQKFSNTTVGGFILPFAKIPANLVKWAVRRMPGAAFLLDDVRNDFKAGGRARDMVIARQVIGATFATAAYEAVKSGALTGGGLSMTPEERLAKVSAGWQPYSLKVGDKYYSYNRFDPIARIASVAADAAEITEKAEADDKANLPLMVGAAFGNALVSQTYLSGISNLMEALKDPTRSGPMMYDTFIGAWIPSFLGQLASATDPNKRRIDGVMDELKSKIPGLRETLLPQVNPLTGEPLQNAATLAPVNVTDISKDPVLAEAARLGVGVSKPPKTLHLKSFDREVGKVELTPEQQAVFGSTAGHIAHQALTTVINSADWGNLPDIVKKKVYELALKQGRKIANAEALTPEQRADEAERISTELEAELNK